MTEEDFVALMNGLFAIACAECPKCAMGLQPELVDGFWRHGGVPDLNIRGHMLCLAAKTHDKMESIEAEFTA